MPLRLAIAQIRPKKGDYAENLRRIGGVLAQLAGLERPPPNWAWVPAPPAVAQPAAIY